MAERDNDPEMKSAGAQLLDRALAILQVVSDAGIDGIKATDVARQLDISQSTAHRILATLMRHGYVDRGENQRRFRLGLRLFSLGSSAADNGGLRQHCRPSVLRLAKQTGDVVFLMVRSGLRIVCVDRQDSEGYSIFSMTKTIGGSIPLGVGCASEIILANLSEDESDAIINANHVEYPDWMNLQAQEVRERTAQARAAGYAVDHGRFVEGISGISVAIRAFGGDILGSLALNMTSARLNEERIPFLLDILRAESKLIEESVLRSRP